MLKRYVFYVIETVKKTVIQQTMHNQESRAQKFLFLTKMGGYLKEWYYLVFWN